MTKPKYAEVVFGGVRGLREWESLPVKWPPECVCCGGPPEKTLSVTATHSVAWHGSHDPLDTNWYSETESVKFSLPVCSSCKRHDLLSSAAIATDSWDPLDSDFQGILLTLGVLAVVVGAPIWCVWGMRNWAFLACLGILSLEALVALIVYILGCIARRSVRPECISPCKFASASMQAFQEPVLSVRESYATKLLLINREGRLRLRLKRKDSDAFPQRDDEDEDEVDDENEVEDEDQDRNEVEDVCG